MPGKPNSSNNPAELRRHAEARLRVQRKSRPQKTGEKESEAGLQRLLHELEVHQIELELQNAELQAARDELEAALEKYTDLYDFAPVGYFTLAADGRIQMVNLAGARLIGMERSRLLGRPFGSHVAADFQPVFNLFLEAVFAGDSKQSCEVALLSASRTPRIVSMEAERSLDGRECRAMVVAITERKQAEETERRIEVLAASNRKLVQEIARRQKVEKALHKSEQHQSRLLQQSRQMQGRLRHLSHQILHAQEEERKRISRELHDEITQTLVGINVRLESLAREAAVNPKGLQQKFAQTQRLVEKMVDTVHRFARELRPAVLDDLGLIPALHAFMKEFTKRTGVRARLTASAAIEQLSIAKRTVLYRVAHEALNNVARHAQASRADVSIEKLPDRVCMKIKDDGKSFQVQRVLRAGGNNRLGLLGMRERLEMVGGSFSVESSPAKGTTVRAEIPVGKVARGAGVAEGLG